MLLVTKRHDITSNARKYEEKYSCLFLEFDTKNKSGAIYFYTVFFMQRMLFVLGIILFHNTPEVQITVCISSSAALLFYL